MKEEEEKNGEIIFNHGCLAKNFNYFNTNY